VADLCARSHPGLFPSATFHPAHQSYLIMDKNRLETISDGIFTIVMTLLILDVKLPPDLPINTSEYLLLALASINGRIVSFVVSFLIIAGFAIGHHFIFSLIHKVNGVFVWVNILYLLTITFIPFPTSLLAQHSDKFASLCLYTLNMTLCGCFHTAMFWGIYKNDALRRPDIKPAQAKLYFRGSLFGTLANGLAILLGLIWLQLGFVVLVAIPVYFIVHRLILERRQVSV
jgi:uncharacterized membrane protein